MSVSEKNSKYSDNIAAKLETHYQALHSNRKTHPDLAMVAARKGLEAIVNVLIQENCIEIPKRSPLANQIYALKKHNCISENISTQMHSLREQTNLAAHDNSESMLKRDVDSVLVLLSGITEWFCIEQGNRFDGSLIELLQRCVDLERKYVEAPLLRELEAEKQKLREAGELAEQSLLNGVLLGSVGALAAVRVITSIKKKMMNKNKAVEKPIPASSPRRARKSLPPVQETPGAKISQPARKLPTPEEKARLAKILQSMSPEQKANAVKALRAARKQT